MTHTPRRRPTLDEVAERAGVSRSAASRVLNNAPHVSREKREAVLRAIQELGYVPNPTARALAARAVLISEGIPSARIYVRALGAAGGDGPADRVDVTSAPKPGAARPP